MNANNKDSFEKNSKIKALIIENKNLLNKIETNENK